jgi:cysteine desulfurase
VLDVLEWLESHGPLEQRAQLHLLELDANGSINLAELESVLMARGDEVALITLMWANNETGVVAPIAKIAELAAKFGVPVNSDAVAALGHVPVDFAASGLSLMSVTGHKVGAPVGIGALVVRRDVDLVPVNHGGGHERKLRSGTLNAVGAKAFAQAASAAVIGLAERARIDAELKLKLINGVRALVPAAVFTAQTAETLPSPVHLTLPGCPGDSTLVLLDMAGVAVSNGSACQAGVISSSHVMLAMGRDEAAAAECIRVSFGYNTTESDIDAFLAALPAAYEGSRKAGDAL